MDFTDVPLNYSWDKLYTTEISNHAADPSDLGTIWFDDSAAEDKILAFLHSPQLGLDPSSTSFLDIGTGNGHFLFRLREPYGDDDDEKEEGEGELRKKKRFTGRILGTDYSPKSIEFCHHIASTFSPPPDPPISFLHFDIITSSPRAILTPPNSNGYDVVLDKGTFDAISLSSETDANGRKFCEGYRSKIIPLVREGGYFLVTSCNWTEGELRGWFEGREGDAELAFVAAIGYQSFRFGGREGQSVSSVCFKKREKEKEKEG
jgi:EEF1A lysine methyltransferase 2